MPATNPDEAFRSPTLPGVQISQGCTEPAAVALCAALAARAVGGEVEAVTLVCDRNTLKNAHAVQIPGGGGARGARFAAALGASGGDPARGLAALAELPAGALEQARALIAADAVVLEVADTDRARLWIEARVNTTRGEGRARLEDSHSRVTLLEAAGAPATLPSWASAEAGQSDPRWEGAGLADVVASAERTNTAELARYLEGLELNLAAARHGTSYAAATACEELATRAELLAAAGSEARMGGLEVAVMTSGFSGNQGFVATLPVWVVAESLGAEREELGRALALSHLVGSYVRASTGVLSPLCNAVHAASAGAAAACARLLGGDLRAMEQAAQLALATAAGTLCDGAKLGCSLKTGLGAGQAVRCAQRAVAGATLPAAGIAGPTLGDTARNLARLAHPALQAADELLLRTTLEGTES